jgi:hypothetical protein
MTAPKEQAILCESLRQKDSCRTHLWRVFQLYEATQEESHQMVKLSGERTEDLLTRGCSVLFCVFEWHLLFNGRD